MTRGLAAGLFVLLGLLMGAPASAADTPFPRTIDEMVTQLHADPILVQPVLGTGDTQGVHDMLTELAGDVGVPVYVILAATPPELDGAEYPAEQGAALLRQELGDGLYIMKFDDGIDYARGFGKAAELELNLGYQAIRTAEQSGPNEYNRTTAVFDAAVLLRAVGQPGQEITDDQLADLMDQPWAFIPTDSHDHADQSARRWVYTIAAGLAVLIAGLTLSRIASRAPLGPRGMEVSTISHTDADKMAAQARKEIDRARQRFDTLSPAELGSSQGISSDEALQAADMVIDSDDQLDQAGAWVLALIASRDLDCIDDPELQPYRPCVVDPTHGEATDTRRLAESSIDAPVCSVCATTQGQILAAHTWRGDRPYLDTNSVWARTGFGALVDDLPSQVLEERGGRR